MELSNQINELILKNMLSTEKNQIKLFNNLSYSMYPARAMGVTLQETGKRTSKEFVFKLGQKVASAAIEQVREEMKIYDAMLPDRLKNTSVTLTILGFGLITINKFEGNELEFAIPNHPVLEPAIERYGEEAFALEFYKGLYWAFFEKWLQFSCKFLSAEHQGTTVIMRGERNA